MTYRKLHSNHLFQLLEEKANHKVSIWLDNILSVLKKMIHDKITTEVKENFLLDAVIGPD